MSIDSSSTLAKVMYSTLHIISLSPLFFPRNLIFGIDSDENLSSSLLKPKHAGGTGGPKSLHNTKKKGKKRGKKIANAKRKGKKKGKRGAAGQSEGSPAAEDGTDEDAFSPGSGEDDAEQKMPPAGLEKKRAPAGSEVEQKNPSAAKVL